VTDMSDRIDALAARVQSDELFLASALENYRKSEGLDRDGLAAALGCPPRMLGPVGLCRRPREERFFADIEHIADRFALDADALAEMVRRANSLTALRREEHVADNGSLMAARDREDGEE
jgi:hypothetical protein